MSTHCLGNHFDIHGGGMDLKFPHHENEIAQSEAATGERFVNVWMHNGFVEVDQEKMSKSLGNFFTIREILRHYPGEVVRLFILGSHYRSPLNYSEENLHHAAASLERLYLALRGVPDRPGEGEVEGQWADRFQEAMDDDFNTPEALAVLFELAREVNRLKDRSEGKAVPLAGELRRLGAILGLLQTDPDRYLRRERGDGGLSDREIEALVAARNAARKGKEWEEADRIRDRLQEAGVILEDGGGGTTWRRR